MLTTTCPLCGLRFPGRPLLDLHLREDHRERARRPAGPAPGGAPGPGTPGGGANTGTPGGAADPGTPGGGAVGPPGGDGVAPGAAGPAREGVTATAARPGPRPGRAMTALRRAIGLLRPPARAGKAA